MPPRLVNRLRRWWLRRDLPVLYDPAYRLPLAAFEGSAGMEPRRADFVAWFLLDRHVLPLSAFQAPAPVSWSDLARVHGETWLDSVTEAETLARIFATSPSEVPVDEVLRSVRLACGGTVEAARLAIRLKGPVLNLLGGFHHAGREFGGGFCAVNDLAVATAVARAEGLVGKVAIIDLDAHPPDGTADCLRGDDSCWIGSISAADWGPLPGVDETVLPKGADDVTYLAALDALLARRPPDLALAFVVAGGDVLATDKLGSLGLSLDGARRRDLHVRRALEGVPSVWVPGGGYSRDAWKVLAGTALVLSLDSRRPIADSYDPLAARFRAIGEGLDHAQLGAESGDDETIEMMLGLRRKQRLYLDYYTAQGVERALSRYGILGQIVRLGYTAPRIAIDEVGVGDRLRVFGRAHGAEHLLVECVLEKKRIAGLDMLYVHWLTLRHPVAQFDVLRPRLPGQETPGLGLAREASEMLVATARRLRLAGVAFRPSWFHLAFAVRKTFRFVDPRRQGRFEALVRDLAAVPLLEATLAVADKRVLLLGEPYTWEADEMAFGCELPPGDAAIAKEEAERVRFTLAPAPA
jgi:acetoin utilization deacetylase AcuC-like enzyme